MRLLLILLVYSSFGTVVLAEDDENSAKDHAKRSVREVVSTLDRLVLTRPNNISMANIDRLVASAFLKGLDPDNHFTIEGDLKALGSGRPFTKMFCNGSVTAFKDGINKLLQRLLEKEKWLDEEFDRVVVDTTDLTLPLEGWKTPAKTVSELKDRWRREAIFKMLSNPTEARSDFKRELTIELGNRRTELRALAAHAVEFQDACLNAVASCTDKYGRFDPKVPEPGDESLDGEGFSVTSGLITAQTKQGVRVVGVIPDSSAARTGKIKPGQILKKLEIKGRGSFDFSKGKEEYERFTETEVKADDEITTYLRSPSTSVTFKAGETISADSVVLSSDYDLSGSKKTRWIAIPNFDRGHANWKDSDTSKQVRNAIMAPGDVDSYVLDLRGNSGGLIHEAVKIASMFVPSPHFQTTSKESDVRMPSDLAALRRTRNKPVIILVDERSASSAEILTGLLQKHGSNVVIGSRSFGKGIGQNVAYLRRGGMLTATSLAFYDRCGKSIQGKGISPDIDFGITGVEERMDATDRVPPIADRDDATDGIRRTREMKTLNERVAKELTSDAAVAELRRLRETRATFLKKYGNIPLNKEKYAEYDTENQAFWDAYTDLGLGAANGSNLTTRQTSPYERMVLKAVGSIIRR